MFYSYKKQANSARSSTPLHHNKPQLAFDMDGHLICAVYFDYCCYYTEGAGRV